MCYGPGANSKSENMDKISSERTVKKNQVAQNMRAVGQQVECYLFWSKIYFAILVKQIFKK